MDRLPLKIIVAIVAAVAGMAAAAGTAQAAAAPDQGWFVGFGIGAVDYIEPGYSNNSLDYLYVQSGWSFNRYLALDARVGANLPGNCGCDYYYYDTNPFNIRVQSMYGVYLRGTAPLTPHWAMYALAGYSSLTLEADATLAFANSTAHSTSFGVGSSWKFYDRLAVDLELLPRLAQGDGWHTDALNLGFHYQF